ncbi:MAG: response regulator [Coleofasciculus sp. S288]|nr:response regulator [Coleofasciculus sp. S288]
MSYSLGLPLHNRRGEPDAMNIDGLLRGLNILLVEDDSDSAELFNVIFELAEARVMTVASARKALEQLESYEPDIVISNLALPDMDGYSLVKKVCTSEKIRGREIIAVAVTASAREVNLAKVMSAGFQAYIPKPINPAMLVTALANLLH